MEAVRVYCRILSLSIYRTDVVVHRVNLSVFNTERYSVGCSEFFKVKKYNLTSRCKRNIVVVENIFGISLSGENTVRIKSVL